MHDPVLKKSLLFFEIVSKLYLRISIFSKGENMMLSRIPIP